MTIKPHGGKLIDLLCKPEEKKELLTRAASLKQSVMSEREVADYELENERLSFFQTSYE